MYSGIGTITLYLSIIVKIIGIESISEAVKAAKENCLLNQINNAFFEEGEMIDVFDESFFNKYGKADVVILDPPRGGIHKKIVKKLLILEPKRIVYVSCNSSTQARDLELIKEKYELKLVELLTCFLKPTMLKILYFYILSQIMFKPLIKFCSFFLSLILVISCERMTYVLKIFRKVRFNYFNA